MPDWLTLTSNAEEYAALGLAALALAVLGWAMDRRRRTRSHPDAVGWVPWSTVSFWASFAALLALGAAAKLWLEG